MEQQRVAVVSEGIDYFSATLSRDIEGSAERFLNWERLLYEEIHNGGIMQPAGRNGFRGFKANNQFIGEREDDYFISYSGASAERAFSRTYTTDMHVSRLDVQVTVSIQPFNPYLGEKHKLEADEYNEKQTNQRRRKIRYIGNNDGGYTLYIGSHKSEMFGRIYNKEAQSNDVMYHNSWRYEVQLQNDEANRVCQAISRGNRLLASASRSYVYEWYSKRGVSPLFDRETEVLQIAPLYVKASDIPTKMEWLRKQVKPTINRLIKLGYKEEVLYILGLGGNPEAEQVDE